MRDLYPLTRRRFNNGDGARAAAVASRYGAGCRYRSPAGLWRWVAAG